MTGPPNDVNGARARHPSEGTETRLPASAAARVRRVFGILLALLGLAGLLAPVLDKAGLIELDPGRTSSSSPGSTFSVPHMSRPRLTAPVAGLTQGEAEARASNAATGIAFPHVTGCRASVTAWTCTVVDVRRPEHCQATVRVKLAFDAVVLRPPRDCRTVT